MRIHERHFGVIAFESRACPASWCEFPFFHLHVLGTFKKNPFALLSHAIEYFCWVYGEQLRPFVPNLNSVPGSKPITIDL